MSSKEVNRITQALDEAYRCRVNNLEHSISLGKEALLKSQKLGDKSLIAKSLNQLSLYYMITGAFDESMRYSRQAIEYFEKLKDDKGIADAKYNIAGLYYKTDNFHQGLIYLIDCLAIYRRYEDYHNQSKVLKSIGTIYEFFGDEKSAIETYMKAIDAAKVSGDQDIESNAYNPLSGIYLNHGETQKALDLIEKSIRMKKTSGDTRGLAFALYGRGKVFTQTREFEKAESDFKESIDIHVRMGEKIGLGMSYHKLGFLYKEMGCNDKAKVMLMKALDFGQSHNIALVKYKSNNILYELYKSEGDTTTALKYHEQYIKEKDVVINTQHFKLIESFEALMKMQALEREAEVKRERDEILKKKELAEQASKMKEDFLSTMSHEIRTPLNAVITIAGLLHDRSDGEDRKLLNSLKFSANNLLLIINDILDFTKLDSGKVGLEPQASDLRGLINSIKDTYYSMAREKGLDLNATIDPELAKSYSLDEVKISQILGNLISNAIKFTEKGKIEVDVRKKDEREGCDIVRFSVRDTGCGIPEEDQKSVFDSFTQPKQLTTRSETGSGLGLAIVKKLIHLHQSEIYLKSKTDKGSTFWFDLKLQELSVEKKSSEDRSNQLKGLRVLVADDMVINLMVASQLLSNWGMLIESVETGAEAIEKCNEICFDYILMDIHMPEMDGYEATMKIRESENPNKDTPIIALTADVTADQRKLYSSLFDAFMLKPIERDKLFQIFIDLYSKKEVVAG